VLVASGSAIDGRDTLDPRGGAMREIFTRAAVVLAAAAMLLGGCATVTGPTESGVSASPPSSGESTNFASPEPLLKRYPELGWPGI
jgi:hypothetical protein